MGVKRPDGTLDDRCLEHIRPGEPFFVLRSQDATAPEFVEFWLGKNGGPEGKLNQDRFDEAKQNLLAMRQWQRDNPDLVKMPD